MNHTLSITYNIDTVIQTIQTALYETLVPIWGEFEAYGRVYKNERDGNTVPEVWRRDTNNYHEVYYNNTASAHMFFIDGDTHTTKDGMVFTTTLKICFMVDLRRIKNQTERVDADVQRDVVAAIRNNMFQDFEITEVEKRVENVFRGFDNTGIQHNDLQPLHVFSVNGNLNYYFNSNCEQNG